MRKPSWYKGAVKQFFDQLAHSVWGWLTYWLYTLAPEAGAVSFGYWCGREQQQSTSKRRFDPHLDWIFFLGNIAWASRWT